MPIIKAKNLWNVRERSSKNSPAELHLPYPEPNRSFATASENSLLPDLKRFIKLNSSSASSFRGSLI